MYRYPQPLPKHAVTMLTPVTGFPLTSDCRSVDDGYVEEAPLNREAFLGAHPDDQERSAKYYLASMLKQLDDIDKDAGIATSRQYFIVNRHHIALAASVLSYEQDFQRDHRVELIDAHEPWSFVPFAVPGHEHWVTVLWRRNREDVLEMCRSGRYLAGNIFHDSGFLPEQLVLFAWDMVETYPGDLEVLRAMTAFIAEVYWGFTAPHKSGLPDLDALLNGLFCVHLPELNDEEIAAIHHIQNEQTASPSPMIRQVLLETLVRRHAAENWDFVVHPAGFPWIAGSDAAGALSMQTLLETLYPERVTDIRLMATLDMPVEDCLSQFTVDSTQQSMLPLPSHGL